MYELRWKKWPCPHGWISLHEALDAVCRLLHGDEWSTHEYRAFRPYRIRRRTINDDGPDKWRRVYYRLKPKGIDYVLMQERRKGPFSLPHRLPIARRYCQMMDEGGEHLRGWLEAGTLRVKLRYRSGAYLNSGIPDGVLTVHWLTIFETAHVPLEEGDKYRYFLLLIETSSLNKALRLLEAGRSVGAPRDEAINDPRQPVEIISEADNSATISGPASDGANFSGAQHSHKLPLSDKRKEWREPLTPQQKTIIEKTRQWIERFNQNPQALKLSENEWLKEVLPSLLPEGERFPRRKFSKHFKKDPKTGVPSGHLMRPGEGSPTRRLKVRELITQFIQDCKKDADTEPG